MGLLAAAVTFVLYASTVEDITAGDAGELLAAAKHRGVAHPPGYPLWTMIVGFLLHVQDVLFNPILTGARERCAALGMPPPASAVCAWIRPLSPARVAGFFSALCASVAMGLVASAAMHIRKEVPRFALGHTGPRGACRNPRAVRKLCAVCAAVALGACESIWRYALQAEIFALNNLLVAIIFSTCVKYAKNPGLGSAKWVAFACGLGMSNQHTLALYVAPVALWVMWVGRRHLFSASALASLSASALVGFLPYAYLPVASYFARGCTWGEQTSLAGFVRHVLRSEYGSFRLAHHNQVGGESTRALIKNFIETVVQDNGWGAAAAVFGILNHLTYPAATDRGLRSVLLLALFLYIGVFALLSNVELEKDGHRSVYRRFWGQGLMVLYFPFVCDAMEQIVLLTGAVLAFVNVGSWFRPGKGSKRPNWGTFCKSAAFYSRFSEFAPTGHHTVGLGIVALVTAVSAATGWYHALRCRAYSRVAYYYAAGLIEGIPPMEDGAPSVLISYKGDVHGYLARYIGDVVQLRSDVRVLDFSNRYDRDFDRDMFSARYPGLRLPKDFPLSPDDAGFDADGTHRLLLDLVSGKVHSDEAIASLKRQGGWCFQKFFEENRGRDGSFYVGGIWDVNGYDLPHECLRVDLDMGKVLTHTKDDLQRKFKSLPGFGHATRLVDSDSPKMLPDEILEYLEHTTLALQSLFVPILIEVRRDPDLWKSYKVADDPAAAPDAKSRMPRLHPERQEASLPLDMLQLVHHTIGTFYGFMQDALLAVQEVEKELQALELSLQLLEAPDDLQEVSKGHSRVFTKAANSMFKLRDIIQAFSVAGVEGSNHAARLGDIDKVLDQVKLFQVEV